MCIYMYVYIHVYISLAIAACGTVKRKLAAAGVPQVIYGWIDINVYKIYG